MIKGRKIIKRQQEQRTKIDIKKMNIQPVVTSTIAGVVEKKVKEKTSEKKETKEELKEREIYNSRLPGNLIALIIVIVSLYVAYDQFFKEKEYKPSYDGVKLYEERDYVYFENEEDFLILNDNVYKKKDIVLNFNNSFVYSLNKEINNSNNELYRNYSFDQTNRCSSTSSLDETDKYLSSFSYREYKIYESLLYISIIVNDKTIDVCGEEVQKVNTYIIEKETGNIITLEDILKEYDTSLSVLVKKAISNRVDGEYSTLDQDTIVNIIISNDPKVYVDSNNYLAIYYKGIGNNDYVFKDVISKK